MSGSSARGMTSPFSKMRLSTDRASDRAQKTVPVDSWEDEVEEDPDSELEGTTTPVRPSTSDLPAPPPPTPVSPRHAQRQNFDSQAFQPLSYGAALDADSYSSVPGTSAEHDRRRPDKTTSVASRLIAAGIGQKAPKRTPEQREYDQAMRLQEKKRRDQAKEEEDRKKREKEQAQKDIWGD